jgi:site-specific DNA recombinase
MLADVAAGRIDTIVTWHVDRLHRRILDLEELIELVERHPVKIATVTAGDVNLDNSTGRMLARITTSVARQESEHKAERIRSKHRESASQGRPTFGRTIPFGYVASATGISPDRKQAPIVREIFKRFASGESLRTIGRDLTGRGVEGQRGRTRWTNSGLGYLVDNPTYAGYRHYNGERTKGTWQPIIPEELWETVHALRVATKAEHPSLNRQGKGNNVLSGLLFCSCGNPMYRSTLRDEVRSSYRCSRDVRTTGGTCRAGVIAAVRTESTVGEAFLSKLAEPYEQYARKHGRKYRPTRGESELTKVDARIGRIAEALLDAPPTLAAKLKDQARDLEAKRRQLVTEEAREEAQPIIDEQRRASLAELRKRLADLRGAWELATPEERNAMLKVAVARVDVLPGKARGKDVRVTFHPELA